MKKIILSVAILILVLILAGYRLKGGNISSIFSKNTDIGQDAAKAKVIDFVKNNLVQPGTDVTVKEIVKEKGLYKVTLVIGKQEIPTYVTTDGTQFFPEAMDMTGKETADNSGDNAENQNADVTQQEVPEVQLFVMSYCPYGTQIEKGILPVLDSLKDKIKFSLKFVDYAMHDKKELDENLRQYCIQKEEPAKLNSYLSCFLKKGQGTEVDCMKSTGVDATKITSCVASSDAQFKVTEKFNDKAQWSGQFPPFDVNKDDNTKYGVQGSPTLLLNGTTVTSARDSASLLKTICSGFSNPPAECDAQLSSSVPSAGFGEGTGSASSASCGN